MTVSILNPFRANTKGGVRETYAMQNGNSKVGRMLTTSNLSGDGVRWIKGVEMAGSCPCTCMGKKKDGTPKVACYALRDETQYTETREYNASQLWGWNNEPAEVMKDYEAQLVDTIARNKKAGRRTIVRIHAAGDYANVDEARFWLRMAMKYSKVRFYVYTKQYGILQAAIDQLLASGEWDGKKIKNFVLNVSVWGEYGKDMVNAFVDLLACNIFEVQTASTPKTGIVRCPAYLPDGKRINEERVHCDHCGKCWASGGKHIVTYEH